MVKAVAIMSPGDMGHSVGSVLRDNGFDVITCLEGRSSRTAELATKGNFRIVDSMEELVQGADLILSILVPSRAKVLAEEVSMVMKRSGHTSYFVDCNAISPRSARELENIIVEAGGKFIDGGIIGTAPAKGDTPRFYVSGPESHVATELDGNGIIVKSVGSDIGQASGI